ncbi:MAG: hypothetical protein PHN74_01020 [Candidatus Pacebacteria bacterium]|nr:hypothetical protein [Candidatus Paceibacterota bacterium]
MIDFKKIAQSKFFRGAIFGIGVFIVGLLIFQAGMFVGYHRAGFSYKLGDNYHRTFGEPNQPFGNVPPFMNVPFEKLSNAHGVIGKIIKIDLPTMVVEGEDKVEKVILIKDDTIINQFRETVKPADLKIDSNITVIGSPNQDSQIEAKLIRIMPDQFPLKK